MKQELAMLRAAMAGWVRQSTGESRADHFMRLAVATVVLLFPSACLLVDRSDSYSLLVLLIVGVIAWVRARFHTGFSRREWLYAGVFLLFFCAGVLAFECGHQTDYGFRLLGRYIRLLLVLPVLIALRRYRPPALLVWGGLGLGALVLGVDAICERIADAGFEQPMGDTNVAILFGDMALLTTFAFAAGYIHVDAHLPKLGPKLMVLGILAGLTASFLSGARGAWLAIPVLLILFLSCRHLLRPRSVLVGGAVILVLFGALYLVPQTHVRARLDNALQQFRTYAYVERSLRDSPAPLCLDDATLLKAWADQGTHSGGNRLKIETITIKANRARSLVRKGCKQATVLRIENADTDAAWVYLPHSVRRGHGASVMRLYMSGNALVHFGTGPHSYRPVHRAFYTAVQLYTAPRNGDRLAMTIPAMSVISLVPVELYTGEYRYTMLQSSVGQRLEMWAVAWRLFKSAPLTGVGSGAYMASAQKLVDEGAAPPVTSIYDHPHDEYLDALSSRGLVGLAALLLLLGLPAWLFTRSLNSTDPVRVGASLAGLLVCVGFAVFGVSETMLVHSVTLGWYVIMTAVFMVTAQDPESQGV